MLPQLTQIEAPMIGACDAGRLSAEATHDLPA
jgi:hypothetical protein